MEAMASAPEGVDVVLTNAEGETVSLASAEAAPILIDGDPWFVVGAITYTFTSIDCDPITHLPCLNPIQAAIDWIGTHATIPTDGLIHIDANTYSGMPVNIDGSNVNVNKIKGLQGTLDATTNLPATILNSQIWVHNMTGVFALSNLVVEGSVNGDGIVKFTDNTGAMTIQDMVIRNTNSNAGSSGLLMNQTGTITLNRVEVSENARDGAVLDNDTGTSGINVSNSSFDRNNTSGGSAGLNISSKGDVSINGISATGNHESGLSVTSLKSLTVKNSNFDNNYQDGLTIRAGSTGLVTLENNYLSFNQDDGLEITLAGDVIIKNILTRYNFRRGVYINTCASAGTPGTTCTALGNGNVTVTSAAVHSNHTNNPDPNEAKGAISLTSVAASANGRYDAAGDLDNVAANGAYLNNADSPTAKTVTIKDGNFNSNYATGLVILSKGSITLDKIISNGNILYDAASANIHGVDIYTRAGTGSVTLLGILGKSEFSSNEGTGIWIRAKGAVSLTNFDAIYNGDSSASLGGKGVVIDNTLGTGGVTLKKFTTSNNYLSAIEVLSNGAVVVESGFADYVGGKAAGTAFAMVIGSAVLPAGSVTITSMQSYWNYINALDVHTRGSVVINAFSEYGSSSATSNPNGARINATYGNGSVTFLNTKGQNRFSQNDGYGLLINANGKVSLTDVVGNNNYGGAGIEINNTTGTSDVVFTKVYAGFNSKDGIKILSDGNVALTTGDASSNGTSGFGFGVKIDNTTAASPKSVSMTDFSANYNNDLGFYILSDGAITGKAIAAIQNANASAILDGAGALLDNRTGTTAGVTLLKGTTRNEFTGNIGIPGLTILTNGSVSISYVRANSNDFHGVKIDNDSGNYGVTINDVEIVGNDDDGLSVYTNGAVAFNTGTFSNNGSGYDGYNVYIISQPSTGAPAISISKVSTENGYNDGLHVEGKGIITLNDVDSNWNAERGIYLDNSAGVGGINILGTLGTNTIWNNQFEGLVIKTDGAVTINKMDVMYNGRATSPLGIDIYHAVDIDNTSGNGDVTINTSDFDSNYAGNGLNLVTNGKVTWVGGSASDNGYWLSGVNMGNGADITNQPGVLNVFKTVSISGVTFENNRGHGLSVKATGAITLSSVKVNDNDGTGEFGADLDNSGFSGGVTINGTGNEFNTNQTYGLHIQTSGAVSLTKFKANGNYTAYGVDIQNAVDTTASPVSVTFAEIRNNNKNGLKIVSNGAITLGSVDAGNNVSGWGAFVNVDIDNRTTPAGTQSVTITKSNFSDGPGNGLVVLSDGNITLNGVSSSSHTNAGKLGVSLNNTSGTGKVDLLNSLGANAFESNNGTNLFIRTNGALTMAGVSSNESQAGYGIDINNTGSTTYAAVTITNLIVNNNNLGGLKVDSDGVISLSNFTGDSNSQFNASLNNSTATPLPQAIKVTNGKFTRASASGNGLTVDTHGAVTLTSITASNNYGRGVQLTQSVGTGAVIVTGTNVFSYNSLDGLLLNVNGAVAISNVIANGNDDPALNIQSNGVGAAVTITNVTMKENNDVGLMISANGVVTVTGIVALYNHGSFADGINIFSNNHNITVTNSISNGNGRYGIFANAGTGTVTLKNSYWFGNGWSTGSVDLNYTGILFVQ
jgi:hypothetical protein